MTAKPIPYSEFVTPGFELVELIATTRSAEPKPAPVSLRKNDLLANPKYDPDALLDRLVLGLGVRNDLGLARALKLPQSHISKIRHRSRPVTAAMLVRMYDATGLSIDELRLLMGVPGATID